MNIFSKITCLAWVICLSTAGIALAEQREVQYLLPQDFRVYTYDSSGVVNHEVEGTQEKILPTSNLFKEEPGCYVACYTRNRNTSVYPVGGDIYVTAQVRVKGNYDGRICKPSGYENSDISAAQYFKKLCEKEFPKKCGGLSCWTGGDTGGWFGIE